MTVFICKHGQTVEETDGIVVGQRDGTLSADGIAQAVRMGRDLITKNISYIVSSDLKRSSDTSKIISEVLGIPYVKHSSFRERHMGVYQGKKLSELGEIAEHDWLNPKHGENIEKFFERIAHIYAVFREWGTKSNVLIVSHCEVCRALKCVVGKKGYDAIQTIEPVKSNEIYLLE